METGIEMPFMRDVFLIEQFFQPEGNFQLTVVIPDVEIDARQGFGRDGRQPVVNARSIRPEDGRRVRAEGSEQVRLRITFYSLRISLSA